MLNITVQKKSFPNVFVESPGHFSPEKRQNVMTKIGIV